MLFDPIKQSTSAFDDYAVVSSSTPDKSLWVDESSELQGNFSLKNCTDFGLTYVGLVKPNGEEHKLGNEALERIFQRLNASYSASQDGNLALEKAVYSSNDEVEDFVKSKYFQRRGLCFVIGWNTFDVANEEFDINLRWNPTQGPVTMLDQVT